MAPNAMIGLKWQRGRKQFTDKPEAPYYDFPDKQDREPWRASSSRPEWPAGRAAAALGPGPGFSVIYTPSRPPISPTPALGPAFSVGSQPLASLGRSLGPCAATWWPKLRTTSQPIPIQESPWRPLGAQCWVLGWEGEHVSPEAQGLGSSPEKTPAAASALSREFACIRSLVQQALGTHWVLRP